MFVDQAKIKVKAGDGGDGCTSFYHDKFTRRGIPDGGDGGKGGDVIIRANKNLFTLYDFQFRRHFKAEDGKNGSGKGKKGADGKDLIISVPLGVTVKDLKTDCVLRSLDSEGEWVCVAKGGRGGRGNQHKRIAEKGEKGQEREILLDLKLISDVGIVGLPNAGKSTLISSISNAHPKIASYPFTTKTPVLGIVQNEDFSFSIADIPGIISGSHEGKGLGMRFLRHIEKTKLLIHLIDMGGTEGREPERDYEILNRELALYSKKVADIPQIIVANKMDLPQAKQNLERFKEKIGKLVIAISALKREGLEELIEAIRDRL
jgi:GTP-binding protein